MFLVLFGVPIVQLCVQNDTVYVLQELEEKDAEQGEDVELEDIIEKIIQEKFYFMRHRNALVDNPSYIKRNRQGLVLVKANVDTPPPKFS